MLETRLEMQNKWECERDCERDMPAAKSREPRNQDYGSTKKRRMTGELTIFRSNLVTSTKLKMLIGHRNELYNSLRWPIYLVTPTDAAPQFL